MSSNAISVFLAGPDMPGVVSRLMFPAFNDPARFQILSMAADWGDVQRDLARYRPDVLVMDAALAPDPDSLRDYLTQMVGTIAIVVLPPTWANLQGQFESIRTSVRGVFIGPANWAAVANAQIHQLFNRHAGRRHRLRRASGRLERQINLGLGVQESNQLRQ